MLKNIFVCSLALASIDAAANTYSTKPSQGGQGILGCTGQKNCTEESWGVDLNGGTGYRWSVDGGIGGISNLNFKLGSLSGSRSMSLWVNNQRISTITVGAADAPRGIGKEYGPYNATLNRGQNSVELRDTENTDEFDVFYLNASCPRPVEKEWVGTYSGNQGISQDFVAEHKGAVVQFNGPGGSCTGTYLPNNLVLTAAHCFGAAGDISDPVAKALALNNYAAQSQVLFNHEHDSNGSPIQADSFSINEVLEHKLGGLDYALIRIDPAAALLHPVARLSDDLPLGIGDTVIAINHTGGQRKSVSTGVFNGQYKDNAWYEAIDLDLVGGASGGALLNKNGYAVSVTAATGCDGARYAAGGNSIHKLLEVSPMLNALFDEYELAYLQDHLNDFESGIHWSNAGTSPWSLQNNTNGHHITTSSATNNQQTAILVTQPFTIDPSTSPQLKFDYSIISNVTGSLRVEVQSNNQWSTAWVSPVSSSTAWKQAAINLAGTYGVRKARFVANKSNVSIDKVIIPDTFTVSSAFLKGYNFIELASQAGAKIHSENGSLQVETSAQAGWHSAQWAFKLIDNQYIKITNRHAPTGVSMSLHTENGPLTFGAAPDSWWSAQWVLEPVAGSTYAFRLRNRFRPGMYLFEDRGQLTAGDIASSNTRSHWIIKKP